jgi:hypothetical protein
MKTKIVPLKSGQDEKLDLETCRKILNAGDKKFSDEEVIRIRDYLYKLAEIECRFFKEWQENYTDNVIPIKQPNHETEESHTLHQGEYRRTG